MLSDVIHALLDLPFLILGMFIESFNGWMQLLGVLLQGAVAVLPGFPSLPQLPSEPVGLLNFYLPITAMVAVLASFVLAFVTWLGVSVALRWVKAL